MEAPDGEAHLSQHAGETKNGFVSQEIILDFHSSAIIDVGETFGDYIIFRQAEDTEKKRVAGKITYRRRLYENVLFLIGIAAEA